MYEAHFGLQGRPFDTGIAHEVDVFRGTRQNTIIDKARLALAASDSVLTFSGPPGIGKTTLALAAVRSISTRLALGWLSSMPTNANEMLELLLVELGINAHRATRIERLQMWRQYLEEMNATETRVFVIAERTEEFAPEVLRALDALTGTDASGSSGANVVLLGHQGLDGFLGSPSLESLRQRIRLRQRLEPFSPAELTDYLRHRVTQVGGNFDQLFAPGAAAAVYRLSAGVARLANTLCEAALTAAAATKTAAITPELITQAAVDMLGVEEVAAPVAPATPPPPATPVAMTSAVTIASVAIDITPVKAAPVVTAPKNASAVPRTVEAVAAPPSAPVTPAPQPVAATAAVTTSATPAPVAPTPAPIPETRLAPVAETSAPTASPPPAPVRAPVMTTVAPAPTPAAPAPEAAVVRPAPIAAPIATLPPAPIPTAVTAPTPVATKPVAPRPSLPDFDATATDIPDVSSFDFPVLTDAVEETSSLTPFARVLAPPTPAPVTPAPMAKTIVTSPPATRASSAPAPRPMAPPLPRPAAVASQPPATRRLLEPNSTAPSAAPPEFDEDSDLVHQTHTMRAISQAKSIDDVSDSMAETLFGEADLDFLSAALASAVSEGEESQVPASAPSPPAPPVDDLMDLFNLGPDAPLELIDDSTIPPGDRRKAAARRGG